MFRISPLYLLRLSLLAGTIWLFAIASNTFVRNSNFTLAQTNFQTTETAICPPFVAAPVDATPVIVITELIAKKPQALAQYLKRADVIPTTRLASGINYSWTVRDKKNSSRFMLIQQWNSIEQQEVYIEWRINRGDATELRSLLSKDPTVTYLNPIDTNTLPAQAKR